MSKCHLIHLVVCFDELLSNSRFICLYGGKKVLAWFFSKTFQPTKLMEWGNIQEKRYFLKDINQREHVEKQEPLRFITNPYYLNCFSPWCFTVLWLSSVAESMPSVPFKTGKRLSPQLSKCFSKPIKTEDLKILSIGPWSSIIENWRVLTGIGYKLKVPEALEFVMISG